MSDISHSLAPGRIVSAAHTPASSAAPAVRSQRQDPAAPGTTVPPPASATAGSEEVSKVVSELNEYVQSLNRELHFSVDENSGRTVITVVNPETDEIIRQIPPEEVLAMARFLERSEEPPRLGFLMRGKA